MTKTNQNLKGGKGWYPLVDCTLLERFPKEQRLEPFLFLLIIPMKTPG